MSEEYDAFEHLCDVLFPEDEDGLMFYWKAFFDRSGKDTPVLTVGGYLSTRIKWKDFRKRWNPLLTTDGRIDVFHATDFEAGQKAFSTENGWPKERREKVRPQLIDAILSADLEVGAACSIVVDEYEEVMRGWRREQRGSAYHFAVKACMRSVAGWCQMRRVKEPIAFVVEAGDEEEGTIEKAFNETRDLPEYRQFFRLGSFTFVPKDQQVPLQAADMLAHYMWKWVRQQSLPKEVDRLISNRGDRLMWSHFDRASLSREIAKDDAGRNETYPEGSISIKTPPAVDIEIEADFDDAMELLAKLRGFAEKHPDLVYALVKDTPSIAKLFTVEADNDLTSRTGGTLRVCLKPTEFALNNVSALRTLNSDIELRE